MDLLLRCERRSVEFAWTFLTGGTDATSGTGQSRSCRAPWGSETVPAVGAEERPKAKAYDRTVGSDEISSMCGHESHCDCKVGAARQHKVGLDCYSYHQSAERLGALKLPLRQGIWTSTCQGALLPGSSLF